MDNQLYISFPRRIFEEEKNTIVTYFHEGYHYRIITVFLYMYPLGDEAGLNKSLFQCVLV